MTYCLGIKVRSGIVGISDARIPSHDTTQAKKVFMVNKHKYSFYLITSGLRSERDMTLASVKEIIEEDVTFD